MRGRILRLSLATLQAALAAALAVTLVGCASQTKSEGGSSTEAAESSIKVGAVVFLTGTYAGLGEPEKNTIEMEVARINEAGGINGHPLEVNFEDDATHDAKANSAANKLFDKDGVVAIIGAIGTGGTTAMRDVTMRAGVPQVSMASGSVMALQGQRNESKAMSLPRPWRQSSPRRAAGRASAAPSNILNPITTG